MTQDRDLIFTWVSRGIFGHTPCEIIGKSQQEIIPEAPPGAATNLKRSVLETGEPARGDIRIQHGIVAIETQRLLRVEAGGAVVEHADLSGLARGSLNDMIVRADGTAYVGDMGMRLQHVGARNGMHPAERQHRQA